MDTYCLCILFKLKALFIVILAIVKIYACGLRLLKHLITCYSLVIMYVTVKHLIKLAPFSRN